MRIRAYRTVEDVSEGPLGTSHSHDAIRERTEKCIYQASAITFESP